MKKCPSCGYPNPDAGVKCGICAGEISGVPVTAAPAAPGRKDSAMLPAGLLLLACGALFFLLQYSPWKARAPARSWENKISDENSYSYEGTLYGLDKISSLRFLPEADKRRVPELLSSPDDRVGDAAARLIGAWARSETDYELRKVWLSALLEAAASGRPAVRRRAALEAGTAMALGFRDPACAARVRRAVSGLLGADAPDLKAAGFFLSSMAGLEEFSDRMRETLLYDPSSLDKLYAACALSRLGHAEGHEYLLRSLRAQDAATRSEAVYCLSYSAYSEAEALLSLVSKNKSDSSSAEAARKGLVFRKQLAIIKQ